jgi:hypothetical protein
MNKPVASLAQSGMSALVRRELFRPHAVPSRLQVLTAAAIVLLAGFLLWVMPRMETMARSDMAINMPGSYHYIVDFHYAFKIFVVLVTAAAVWTLLKTNGRKTTYLLAVLLLALIGETVGLAWIMVDRPLSWMSSTIKM